MVEKIENRENLYLSSPSEQLSHKTNRSTTSVSSTQTFSKIDTHNLANDPSVIHWPSSKIDFTDPTFQSSDLFSAPPLENLSSGFSANSNNIVNNSNNNNKYNNNNNNTNKNNNNSNNKNNNTFHNQAHFDQENTAPRNIHPTPLKSHQSNKQNQQHFTPQKSNPNFLSQSASKRAHFASPNSLIDFSLASHQPHLELEPSRGILKATSFPNVINNNTQNSNYYYSPTKNELPRRILANNTPNRSLSVCLFYFI